MGGAWRYTDRRPLPIDKTIFCNLNKIGYGLPLIVEELNKYGVRATFFTEMFFSYCLGTGQTQSVVDYLLANDQDIQLHIHPVFRNYSHYLKQGTAESFRRFSQMTDALNDYDAETQYELISEGAELFRRFVGDCPVAFRAGGFRGDENTLVALRRAGIKIDCSYNPSVPASFQRVRPVPNVAQVLQGTIEIPLTNAMSGLPHLRGWKPMAISSVSFSEVTSTLEQAHSADLKNVVLILHPFSMVKPRDIFYSAFRPNQTVISRFRRLMRFLADNTSNFELCTMRDAVGRYEQLSSASVSSELNLGFLKPLIRKAGQALDRVYWI
jgi:hypothetical protein